MTILLTEEPSMQAVLECLIERHFPARVKHVDWKVLAFSGKSDLEKRIPITMRGWNWGSPSFVILRDNDGGDCLALKERLRQLALSAGKPFRIRIVCQELEGWFIGDSEAVRCAYPRCQFTNETARYRNPDRLTNASEELHKLTGDRTKKSRAETIAPHLDPARNRSNSFRVLFETLTEALG